MSDTILISYPRSGITWVQFILSNLYFPDIEHDFNTVHRHIPSLDSENEMKYWKRVNPQFFKSHTTDYGNDNIIYIYRHVGDVLISFFHFFRKFYNLPDDFCMFLKNMDYGKDWRESVNYFIGSNDYIIKYNKKRIFQLRYENMIKEPVFWLESLKNWIGYKCENDIKNAIDKSSFLNMSDIEDKKGLSIYDGSNKGIKFVRKGIIGQWKELPQDIQNEIIEKNYYELKMLQYI